MIANTRQFLHRLRRQTEAAQMSFSRRMLWTEHLSKRWMFKRKLELEWYLYLQSEWDDYNFCDMEGRFRGLNNHRRCWEKKASKESAKYVMSFCEWMAEKVREMVKALRATREGKLWLLYRSKCRKELKRLRYGSTRECWKCNERSMWYWGGFKNKKPQSSYC